MQEFINLRLLNVPRQVHLQNIYVTLIEVPLFARVSIKIKGTEVIKITYYVDNTLH
jgi:hypothetical protein